MSVGPQTQSSDRPRRAARGEIRRDEHDGSSAADTAPNVAGSLALTPKKSEPSTRVAASAPATPIASPAAPSQSACEKTSDRTVGRLRAERHPDADFAAALRNRVRHHAEETEAGQHAARARRSAPKSIAVNRGVATARATYSLSVLISAAGCSGSMLRQRRRSARRHRRRVALRAHDRPRGTATASAETACTSSSGAVRRGRSASRRATTPTISRGPVLL